MTGADVVMLGIAVIGGSAALLVVTARNVVHAALYLVVALLSVAGTFLLVGAEFLAWTQVLVYVGAVVVLILFGLMLTRAPIGPMAQHNESARLALLVSVALFGFLTTMILGAFGGDVLPLAHTTAGDLGEVLYVAWAFPFMVLGFFLTVSLIGAIILARREEGEGPEPLLDPDLATGRPEPAATDASSTPGVTRPSEEVPR
ncbi:MAG TPA: NADH-quinone oxidoreductase subunit J [Egibacteraceae bacterium]|jgi:NADH-quinone oxidoreductase subunit J|nr:NADH-quinone oxidoreductase subunit J [Egibacteraceae bacterium]